MSMKKRFGLVVLMLSLAVPGAVAADTVEVNLGYSQVIGPISDMATVIVGNDHVAGATLGGGGTIILTGKSVGATNLIILDETGREVLASSIRVVPLDRRPTTNIRITKGVSQAQDYVCGAALGCTPVADNSRASSAPVVGSTAGDESAQSSPQSPESPQTPESPEADAPAAQEQVSLNP